jgi:mycofactocin precursor
MPPSVAAVGEICQTSVSVPEPAGGPVNHQPTIEDHPATAAESDGEPGAEPAEEHLVAETLVEEVSIDGMCGVY